MDLDRPRCTHCRTPAVPVLWGKPASVAVEAEHRGLLRLGGCIVRGEPHTTWWCPVCERTFVGHDTASALTAAIADVDEV